MKTRADASKSELLAKAQVLKKLPCIFGRNQQVPNGLEGATIIAIGTLENSDLVEGGGLVIDYRPQDSNRIERAILGCTEIGMWVEYCSGEP